MGGYVYRNRHTDERVERRERDARLDGLTGRWELVEQPDEQGDAQGDDGERHGNPTGVREGEPEHQPVHVGAPGNTEQGDEQTDGELVGQPLADDVQVEPMPETEPGEHAEPEPAPARDADKDEWVDYAVRRGMPRTKAARLTKAQLVTQFG